MATSRIVVCKGDQTGQELLDQALRVLSPEVLDLDIEFLDFDLSLENRRATANGVVHEAAEAMKETGLGLKAATITPEERDGVGSPNRILREGIDGKVIVRTGRRIPGVQPIVPMNFPVVVVRMAVGDAYGAKEGREGTPGAENETAWRTEVIERAVCRSVAEYTFVAARAVKGLVYGGPKWTVSPTYEGMLKEELDAAAARHSDIVYRPMLIDAAYAGLITEGWNSPVVIPSLNRDGDVLSDLVLAMFGSIGGAESTLLALDDQLKIKAAMAEAPHGTAPSLQGKNVANPMAMLLACASILEQAGFQGNAKAAAAAPKVRAAVMGAAEDGIRTFDLGGSSSTSGFVDEVISRLKQQ